MKYGALSVRSTLMQTVNEAALERAASFALDDFAGFPVLRRMTKHSGTDETIAVQVPVPGTGGGLALWLSWPAAWELASRVLCYAPGALSTDQVVAVALELAEEICGRYLLEVEHARFATSAFAASIPPNEGDLTPQGVTLQLEVGILTVNWVPMDNVVDDYRGPRVGITQILHSIQ